MAKRTFLENELDKYDQTTYHIKLFMLPEALSSEPPYNSDEGVLIAESGVTGQIFVSELSFTNYISLHEKNMNSNAVNFDITLREFSGSSLMDVIFATSLDLGIRNYMKAPYFIEVSFRARGTEEGKTVTPSGLKWVWPLLIQGIETDVDEGGSSYTIKAYMYSQMAQKEPFNLIDKAIQLKDVETVKEATDKLAFNLSLRGKEKAATTYSLSDVYTIKYPTTVGGKSITNKLGELALRPNTTTSITKNKSIGVLKVSNPGVTNIQIEANRTVIELINNILVATDKYQQQIKQSDDSNSQATDGKKMKLLHKVVTSTKLLEYDITRGDYQREFIYEIIPYEMGTLQTSPNETIGDLSTEKYNMYRDKGILEKKYNYLFTGENDQILEFNLKFNHAWYANVPKQAGINTQSSAVNESQHFDKSYDKYLKLREMIMEKVKNMSSAGNAYISAGETNALSAKIQEAELSDEQKIQLESLLRTQTRDRLPADQKDLYSRQLKQRRSTYNGPLTSAMSADVTPSSRFASDYDFVEMSKVASMNTEFRMIPLTYLENSKDKKSNNMQTSIEGNEGGGREYANSLFQQAFSGKTGDLVSIEMKVKGDPYWIGPNQYPVPTPSSGIGSQIFMLFSTKTPDIPRVSTGVIDTRPTALNGIYSIWRIDNTFQDGMFTQVLHGVRDPLINISQIEET